MRSKKEIVILGGTGFIGDALTSALNTRDNINLSIIYKNSFKNHKLPNVKYYQINASKQGKKLGKIINNSECLIILSQPDKQLIENITKFGFGIKKIIYASTLLLYPNSHQKQNENSSLEPFNDYEEDKLAEEKLLATYAKTHNTKLCIVRLTNIYGDVKNKGIIQKIFSALLNNKEIAINGSGNQLRDYLFIDDVIPPLVYLLLSNQEKPLEIFNICSAKGQTLNSVISIIEEITDKKLLRLKGKAVKEKKMIIGDNKKIIKFSGFKPQFNLKNGLKRTYQNNLKHGKTV